MPGRVVQGFAVTDLAGRWLFCRVASVHRLLIALMHAKALLGHDNSRHDLAPVRNRAPAISEPGEHGSSKRLYRRQSAVHQRHGTDRPATAGGTRLHAVCKLIHITQHEARQNAAWLRLLSRRGEVTLPRRARRSASPAAWGPARAALPGRRCWAFPRRRCEAPAAGRRGPRGRSGCWERCRPGR